MDELDTDRVAAGYDRVYAGLPHSSTFDAIWREHSLGDDYPAGFEHISFLTLAEMRAMAAALNVDAHSVLVDLACGMGGPGLWIARETGARLVGIDISTVALDHARARAAALGISTRARFTQGSFASTGLEPASADAVMSVDALQYAPDKQAALNEAARILRPGGRLVFACFELDPVKVDGLPVLGADAVADYRPLLDRAGFDVETYAETPAWLERLTATYQAVIDAKPSLTAEMGEDATSAILGEVFLTLQIKPYRRRILATATKRSAGTR